MLALDHSVIVDINGKLGGVNYRKDKCGLHMQQNPPKRKRKSKYEDAQRKSFREVVNYWGQRRQKISVEDEKSWSTYANKHYIQNKKGETKKMSAYQAFVSVNLPRRIENLPIISNPDQIGIDTDGQRLTAPYATSNWPNPTTLEVTLHFPQQMNADLYYTPPLEDFDIMQLTSFGIGKAYDQWKPYAYYWYDDSQLVLVFKVAITNNPTTIKYTKSSAKLLTYEENRSYGSFTIERP